jgi:membrane protein DedA with SNARE-associated domain
VLKIPRRAFRIVWSVLGTIVRCYLLAFLGWQMGGKALELAHGVDRFESLISMVIALGVVAGILYVRHRVRKGLGSNKQA